MGISGGPDIIQDGLVLALDAADRNSYPGSGTTWADMSGNGNNGTLTNGPTFNSANGGSIVFDGVDDYVNCGIGSLLNITSSVTLICWIKLNGNPSVIGNPNVIDKWDWPNNLRVYSLGTEEGKFSTSISRDGSFGNRLFVTESISPSLNQFYFLVSTYNGQTLSLYKNATLISTASYMTTYPIFNAPTTETWVGRSRDAGQGGRWISANTYNLQIHNRALSASEILQNYNAQKSRFNL